MRPSHPAILLASAIAGTSAAGTESTTLVSFYEENECAIGVGSYVTVKGDNVCHALNTPNGTGSYGAGHAGVSSCLTYYESATCDSGEGVSQAIFLDGSTSSSNNLQCSTESELGFVPQAVAINDNTDACRANTITIDTYTGPACQANTGVCVFNDAPDGASVRCHLTYTSGTFRWSQSTSRNDYVAYAFKDPYCDGEPDAGPFEEGTCGGTDNLGCVRVTLRAADGIESDDESYEVSQSP